MADSLFALDGYVLLAYFFTPDIQPFEFSSAYGSVGRESLRARTKESRLFSSRHRIGVGEQQD